MPFVPKALAALISDDPTLARVANNVRQAVQPTLDFLNANFTQAQDGSLRLLRNTVAQGTFSVQGAFSAVGSLTAQGLVRLVGDTAVYGNAYFVSRTTNGFVIQPSAPGAAFYITNVAGNAANIIIFDTGAVQSFNTITAANMVSNAGFKAVVDMGHYYHTSYPGGQRFTVEAIINQANTGQNYKTARYIAPRAGSVTSLMIDLEFAVNARTDAGVLINGNLVVYGPVFAANVTKGSLVFAKGAIAFNAGDVLTCYVGWNATSINACSHVNFEIELGA